MHLFNHTLTTDNMSYEVSKL